MCIRDRHIGEILGIDEDKVCTNLLPQDKVSKLEEIKSKSKKGTIFAVSYTHLSR